MGTLFALMGMDSWFFGRIDYQDRALRQQNQQMEVIMRPSKSLGDNVDIFTGVMNGYGGWWMRVSTPPQVAFLCALFPV